MTYDAGYPCCSKPAEYEKRIAALQTQAVTLTEECKRANEHATQEALIGSEWEQDVRRLEAQVAALTAERDEAVYGADEVGRVAQRWQQRAQDAEAQAQADKRRIDAASGELQVLEHAAFHGLLSAAEMAAEINRVRYALTAAAPEEETR